MMSKQTYIVAVDGSEWGSRAADFAVKQAKIAGASVVFITVIPWSGFTPMTMDEIAHRPIDKQLEEDAADAGVLTPLMEKHGNSGVPITKELHWGDPRDVIAERIKALHAVQVFAGRRGRSRLSDLILGSVANSLAHYVGIPITLVP